MAGNNFASLPEEIVSAARANVPDCRLGYVEVQLSKDEVDALAVALGLPPIDWHPEPCKHPGEWPR